MSGYPYGNPGGGYPPYGGGYQQPPPPPIPQYGDNQSCASLYGTQGPYDQYGGNQMPPNPGYPPPPQQQQAPYDSYGFGGGNNYQAGPPPPQQPPPQQYGGYGNQSYQAPYPSQGPPPQPSGPGGMYPNMSGGGYPPPPSQPQQPFYPGQQQQGYYPEPPQSVILASLEQYQGTVFPTQNFNPETDCRSLGQAMKGAGTNEQALIEIVANRSNVQRQQIKLNYKTMYGVDLVKKIAGETSGRFEEVLIALFDAPANFEAWSLHNALNAGKEGPLREVLLTRTNAEIRAIVLAYQQMFRKSLEHEITHRAGGGGDFKRMLVSAVQANREELTPQQIQQARQMGLESVIDRNRARQDADDLYKAGEGKWGTDEKTFNAIFARRSYYQLRATFEEYQRKYHKDIAQVIRSEFSGDAKDGYLTMITCIRDRPAYFAERLHKAISGIGTRDSTLIRVIVSRSEIDLVQVKQRYQQMYNRSLARDVAGDTSGDYERILLAIVK